MRVRTANTYRGSGKQHLFHSDSLELVILLLQCFESWECRCEVLADSYTFRKILTSCPCEGTWGIPAPTELYLSASDDGSFSIKAQWSVALQTKPHTHTHICPSIKVTVNNTARKDMSIHMKTVAPQASGLVGTGDGGISTNNVSSSCQHVPATIPFRDHRWL